MGRRKIPYKVLTRDLWARKMDAEFWKREKEERKREENEGTEIEESEGSEIEESEEESEAAVTQEEFSEVEAEELFREKYRCRSAYKLIEINDKYKIFQPGQVVVDLGCCPGSWTQVAVQATRAKEKRTNSLVVGLDIQRTKPIEGAHILNELDFLETSSQQIIKQALKKRLADVLISDMAPSSTGITFSDHMKVSELCYSTLNFVPKVCKPGGTLVMKAFDGEECKKIIKDLRFLFGKGIVVHPKATRQPSSEFFYVGLKYKGNKLEPRNDDTD